MIRKEAEDEGEEEERTKDREIIEVKERGIKRFVENSQRRGDRKHTKFRKLKTAQVHIKCQKSYTREQNVIAAARGKAKGIDCLEKPYHIELKPDTKPVELLSHLRDKFKRAIDSLVEKNINEKFVESADWVNALVLVKKPTGQTRICLDPCDLNNGNVIDKLKAIFARFGIPRIVCSGNGPEFSSLEFKIFSQEWKNDDIKSSLLYPQSNGQAVQAVQTVKTLLKNAF
ncbi:hypothetical protein ILUMI_24578 [Ignelater luminosus]|uniref:Integrase catalytic domain-containing protein n=1 Tax=Ignelater luminosus TaxID=2038154 RepID=A0A8K0FWJ1_IGNLU|nr:hypothetical protein ILUMI_24578 [Ignelater luminosus]